MVNYLHAVLIGARRKTERDIPQEVDTILLEQEHRRETLSTHRCPMCGGPLT